MMARKIQRIMLVIPNQKWYRKEAFWHLHPYALAILAAMPGIRERDIKIVDANIDDLSEGQFEDVVRGFRPDLMGASVLANEFGITGHIACECAKHVSPSIVTVLGGVYATTRPADAIRNNAVDYAVIGEGEYVFPALVRYLEDEGDLPKTGLAFRSASVSVIQERAPFVEPLDALPYPSFCLTDFLRYATESFKHVVDAPRALPYAKMITSRGCPIGCTFCQVEVISGKITRFQSAKRVVDEMEWLVKEYGVKAIDFLDDNFLGHKGRSEDILAEMIMRDVPVVWNAANVSSWYLNEMLLDLMKRSGCQYVSIAVESGVERVLKHVIKKPVKLPHVKAMVDYAKKLGMDTTTLWVIGSPGETWEEIRETIRVAEWIDADYTKINVATPYPGTELFDMAVEGGYMSPEFDFDDLAWGQATISTEEFGAKELTVLRAFEWDRINFTKPEKRQRIARMMGITLSELDDIRRKTRQSALDKVIHGQDEAANMAKARGVKLMAPRNVGDMAIAVNS